MQGTTLVRSIRVGPVAVSALLLLGMTTAAAGPARPAAVAGSASVANDVLTVTGTDASERIALRLAPGVPTTLQVDFGDDGSAERQFNRNTFTRVVVRAGAGNDKVRVDEINGRFVEELVTLDGGQGDDTLNAGAGVDVVLGGTGNDTVDGAQGNDTVDLGSGQDTFTWSPGDANDTIEGQAGNDTVEFTGSDVAEVLRLSADGARSTLVRNIADVTLDMNAIERVDLATLGGIDTVTIGNMSGTTVHRAVVDLSNSIGTGDGQPDTVTVSGIVDGSQAAIAAVEGRIELQGLRTSVGVAGSDTIDLLDVTARGGPQADVADIMDVELTLTQSGFSHADGS